MRGGIGENFMRGGISEKNERSERGERGKSGER